MTTISRPQIEETPGERTAVRRAARPYVHPYAGGMLLGLVLFTTFFLTATTFVMAGLAREQVCTYMCPWPRFQAAMLDEHSLVVTYRAWRGEKRGKAAPNLSVS